MIPVVQLTEVAQLNPRLITRPANDAIISFLAMADVGIDGTTSEGEDRQFSDTTKGYTQFRRGDILVAKITPCFENGKIAQAQIRNEQGAGSTEFHVIRPNPSFLNGRYLHHFLRQPIIRFAGEHRMTGSGGQRRIPEAYLSQLKIPIPPFEKQQQIAEALDQADALRAKRRQAITLLEELAQSTFHDMFMSSDGVHAAWPSHSISDVCNLVVDCINRTAPTVETPTPYKMIRTTNVRNGIVDLSSVKYVDRETFTRWNRRATPRPGDVLLTREAPVGEAGILYSEENVFLGQRLMLYRTNPELITPEYLLAAFRSNFLARQFQKYGSGSTVKHLPLPACRNFEIPLPPISLQRRYENRIQNINSMKTFYSASLKMLDDLFNSLQSKAFRGEL
ncbi:restriction endonuclease subunit S [Spirillospora sp. CA-253888]